MAGLATSFGSGAMTNSMDDVAEQAKTIFIIGSNTTEQHPVFGTRIRQAVLRRGVKLIVADPRRIDITEFAIPQYGGLHLRHRSGTDVPLINGLMYIILEKGWEDRKFIDDRTEGFDEFRETIAQYSPKIVAQITGVPEDQLYQAAEILALNRPMAVMWAMGITQHIVGVRNVMDLANLQMLLGNMGIPGGGVNPLRGQNNVQGACDMGGLPNVYPGYQAVTLEAAREKFEAAWGVSLPDNVGMTVTEMVPAAGKSIKALYIMGENPMMSEPNLNHTRHQMEQLEFVVAQDLYINESGAFADVFLPAVSWAEKDGTFTNTDRRVQRVRQAIAPRGQARPDWQIICDLAKRLETRLGRQRSAGWAYTHPSQVMAEIGTVYPDCAGITYERIEPVGLQTPVWDAQHPGTPFLFSQSFPRGRGKFHPLEYQPSAEMPDEDYPLILTTGRVLEHWHGGTLTRHSNLDDLYPEALVEVNPADAVRLNVADGQPVRVTSRRGSIVLRARVTQKITPGVVFIPFFFREAAANLLTNNVVDPQAKIPEYKACAVRVTLADENELADPQARQKRGRY